jgi:hypothetical protein
MKRKNCGEKKNVSRISVATSPVAEMGYGHHGFLNKKQPSQWFVVAEWARDGLNVDDGCC